MPSVMHPSAIHRMTTVREAFRLRRLAGRLRRRSDFYLEHNLLEEAREARQELLASLRRACHQWRLALGIAS
jgi:hypothetical protein